ALRDRLHLGEAVVTELLGMQREALGERRAARAEPHIDEAKDRLAFERMQAEGALVETGQALLRRHAAKRAGELVAPGVIGAGDDAPAASGLALDHRMSSVTADIVEGADFAILGADHEGALAHGIEGHVVAGVAQLAHVADRMPRRHVDALDLLAE